MLRISSKLIQKNSGAVLVSPKQFPIDADKGKMEKRVLKKKYRDHKIETIPNHNRYPNQRVILCGV